MVSNGGTDWRFPDHSGLSERTLDCLQLCQKAVLQWKGERRLIHVFLDSFDCKYPAQLQLRRKQSELQLGWHLTIRQRFTAADMRTVISSLVRECGYCLIRYDAYHMPLSRYCHKYKVNHWALVAGVNEIGPVIIDDTGIEPWFQFNRANISWDYLGSVWEETGEGVAATLGKQENATASWDRRFPELIRRSVNSMRQEGGLHAFSQFIEELERTESALLSPMLEQLEFDFHYYRRLRELWYLAVKQHAIPDKYVRSGWIEELTYICKGWALIMGVTMKWKKQPGRDYRSKLVNYLKQVLHMEESLFDEFKQMAGEG